MWWSRDAKKGPTVGIVKTRAGEKDGDRVKGAKGETLEVDEHSKGIMYNVDIAQKTLGAINQGEDAAAVVACGEADPVAEAVAASA